MTDWRVREVRTDDEMRLACDLMAKVHCSDYFTGLHWLESIGAGYPGFRTEHVRIALDRTAPAGALRLNLETVRIGEARLRMGGLGWVSTAPRYRGKGVARALIVDALKYLATQRCHVSMLFGIPNFYHRFGFATTLAEYAVSIGTAEAAAIPAPTSRMRHGKPGDIRAIQRLHEANDTDTACSIVRSAAHITNQWERWKGARVLTNHAGRVHAYFLFALSEEDVVVQEAGVADEEACAALLRACVRIAGEEHRARLRFRVPPTHPMSRFLHQYKSLHEVRLARDSGGMMAVLNLEETLESLVPEWETLLARHEARDWREEITLVAGGISCRIRMNRGAIDVCAGSGKNKIGLESADMVHLLAGYRYPEDILQREYRVVNKRARTLFELFFPKRAPYVWPQDRF